MDLVDYGLNDIGDDSGDKGCMTISEMRELLNDCQARFENLGRRL